jgi:oxygen-independent coproporphyrinogen-3 oxidase
MLRKMTDLNEFEHYEISNFAREGYRSKHNTTYWNGESYFGFGPSAHSFSPGQRRWNISSLKNYIDLIEKSSVYFSSETLSLKDQYHDYLITRLRTREGAELEYVQKTFGKAALDDLMRKSIPYIEENELSIVNSALQMTPEGWLKSDMIISDLMLAEKLILPEPPLSQ